MKTRILREPTGSDPQDWADVAGAVSRDYVPSPESAGPKRYTTWLTTTNPDGSPHVTPVGAVWLDETFWFQTGESTRKAKNLDRDARCAMSISVDDRDLVVEGAAERVADTAQIERVVAEWNKGGWPCELDPSGAGITAPFNAPAVGPPPWFVYRMTPSAATSVMTTGEDAAATRYEFDAP